MAAVVADSWKTKEIIFVNKQTKEIDFNYLKGITDDFSKNRINLQGGLVLVVQKYEQKAPVLHDRLQIIVTLQHENIVKFIGYCSKAQKISAQHQRTSTDQDISESYLCYEYSSKGSLDDNLFVHPDVIDWKDRFKIIVGICQALILLHKFKPDQPIIHMNLNPKNILLDGNLAPKIADFGLAIQFDNKQLPSTDKDIVVGSYGCMAPEYPYKDEISVKSDIYRLGLLLIQITTREKIFPKEEDPSAREYIDKICEKWTEEHIASEYPQLDSHCLQQVKACIKIGLECVEIDPDNRPSIDKIVDELNKRDV